MPKRVTVVEHASIAELEQLYKQATGGVESRQYQVIWLLAQGKKTEEVTVKCQVFCVSPQVIVG